jgi:DNA polymerase-4
VIVPPDFSRYRSVSTQIFDLYRAVTPLVEPLSLDEAYLDVTVNAWGETLATPVARRLKEAIRDEVGLTASAGVAPNKFLAKIASGWKKPDGLTVIPPERVEPFLQQLPIDALWGVGPVTAARLRARGLERLIDVRKTSPELLREAVGSQADWLQQLALGIDDRPVEPNRPSKSAGTENTYPRDLIDGEVIRSQVDEMARDAARWLERHGRFARTVTLKVRYNDFSTITRSATTPPPTRDPDQIARRAVALLERTDAGRRPIRLLGVSVHNLSDTAEVPSPTARDHLLPFDAVTPGYTRRVTD